MKKVILLVILFTLTLFGCNLAHKQSKYLLPDYLKVKKMLKKHDGITTLYVYSFNEKLEDTFDISQYPKNKFKIMDKKCVKWHHPSSIELQNIKKFIEEEQKIIEIRDNIYNLLGNEYVFISYFYYYKDKDLNNANYDIYTWLDLYILDTMNNKIYYIKYGEF